VKADLERKLAGWYLTVRDANDACTAFQGCGIVRDAGHIRSLRNTVVPSFDGRQESVGTKPRIGPVTRSFFEFRSTCCASAATTGDWDYPSGETPVS
jgi:hypothetical protein